MLEKINNLFILYTVCGYNIHTIHPGYVSDYFHITEMKAKNDMG